MRTALFALCIAAAPAHAYETDQLTHRSRPLVDAREPANAQMNRLLAQAAGLANAQGACTLNDADAASLFADHLHALTSPRVRVTSRPPLRKSGFGTYSGWLETAEIDRISFVPRDDIFHTQTPWQSVILTFAGPSSTIELAGVRIGTDKIDHFVDTGYHYWRWSDEGADVDRAFRLGTATERTLYGMLTSKTFSFGDLAANEAGMRFYAQLLQPGSNIDRGDLGCLTLVRPFDWAEWVDWQWDEVLNPSVHTRLVQRRLNRYLAHNPEHVCEGHNQWGPQREAHLTHVLSTVPDYVRGDHPRREDPYRLADLCEDGRYDDDRAIGTFRRKLLVPGERVRHRHEKGAAVTPPPG